MTMNRRAQAELLAEDLLTDIELERISSVSVIRRALRLARLLDDAEAIEWLSFELTGYELVEEDGNLPSNAFHAALRSGRATNKSGSSGVIPVSVGELQASIDAEKMRMSVTTDSPGVTAQISRTISQQTSILNRILGSIYKYVSEKSYELRFGSAIESTFDRIRDSVDRQINDLVPDAVSKLAAAFELVASDNPEHWADAASYCRKLIKAVADTLQPPGSDIGGRASGEGNYVNRLAYWIQKNESSSTAADVLTSDLEYFGRRLDAFTDAGNKGAHSTVSRYDADRFILGTYILIADILRLQEPAAEDSPSTEDAHMLNLGDDRSSKLEEQTMIETEI